MVLTGLLEINRLKLSFSIVCRQMYPIVKAVYLASDGVAKGLVRKLVIIIFDGQCSMENVLRLCSLYM